MRVAWMLVAVLVCLTSLLPACGSRARPLASKDQTWAELRVIRRGVEVLPPSAGPRAPHPRERLVDGERIVLDPKGLAWMRRDGGESILVKGPATLEMIRDAFQVVSGKVFIETPPGSITKLITPQGPLQLTGVRASIVVEKDTVRAYVLTGEIRAEGVASVSPGEELTLADKVRKKAPVTVWEDWTGGLATTDATAAPAPFGVGTVGARLPSEKGKPRWPLTIQSMEVRVTIDADLAITEVDQVFFNPTPNRVEGVYRFRTPPGATLHRFGVDRDGDIVWGYVKEQKQAAAQYEAHVYAGSREDPALLEWEAPGVFRARLYPIESGRTRRVITRYAEWLPRTGEKGGRRLYLYPMAAEGAESSLPRIDELLVTIDLARAGAREVRVGMEGMREGNTVVVRAHDFVPRADLAVELIDAGTVGLHGYRAVHAPDLALLPPSEREAAQKNRSEDDYILVPVRPQQAIEPSTGLDLAVVVDASAATDPAAMAVARAATSALLAHLGPDDRGAVWIGDVSLRPVTPQSAKLQPVDEARRRQLVAGLAKVQRGGATDLGAILTDAAGSLDPQRRGTVVYIGDGLPTVGEETLQELRERLERLPHPIRLYTLGVGENANMSLLAGLTQGGFSDRVSDAHSAAMAALRVMEEAERPAWLKASVSLGPGIERIYPRQLGQLSVDEPALLIGRIKGAVPTEARLTGPGGEVRVPLQITAIRDEGDMMRRWAEGRLVELLDEGAGRAAVVEAGLRYGIVTPFTSLYVPTRDEAERENLIDSSYRPRRFRLQKGKDKSVEEAEQVAEDNADNKEGGTGTRAKGEEGSMGNPNTRFGVAGPRDNSDPHVARSAALREAAEFGMIGLLNAGAGGDPDAPPPPPAASAPAQGATAANRPEPPIPIQAQADLPVVSKKPRFSSGLVNLQKNADVKSINTEFNAVENQQAQLLGKLAVLQNSLDVTQAYNDKSQPFWVATYNRLQAKASSPKPLSRGELAHVMVQCSPAATLPLGDRVKLWQERLTTATNNPAAAMEVFRQALRDCEAPGWRDRSQLLSVMVDAMTSIPMQVGLWRLFDTNTAMADAVYGMILRRIHSATDLRLLNEALGLRTLNAPALAEALKNAKTADARAAVLQKLIESWPDDLRLQVLLLHALEDTHDTGATKAIARNLRLNPDVDVTARTAVGELYFRLGASGNQDETLEGLRTFGEIVEFAPDDPAARRRLGDLLRAHGYYAEAARQYESLEKLRPDDPNAQLLRACAAMGLGKVEEAVRWTEKAAGANAPDGASGSGKISRALALTFLAWAREDARKANQADPVERLLNRSRQLIALDPHPGAIRVALTWAHPDLHPILWTNALGTMMPAADGDPMLGIAQAILASGGGLVQVRLEQDEAETATRFQLQAVLTVVFAEGTPSEKIIRLPVSFTSSTLQFTVGSDSVTQEVK